MQHREIDTEWLRQDRRHVWHPYTQMKTAPSPLPIARAEGVYLHTADGRRILDGISSWWVNIHGHNHPRLNRALSRQAASLAQVIFAGCTHEPGARLASELVQRTPAGLNHVFYSDNGSTAVEVGLKMAYQYWRNRGEKQRRLFVALEHAYHGDTFGSMATSGPSIFHEEFRHLLFEVQRACFPAESEESRYPPLDEIMERDGDRIAAVIIEPILQGAGGMLVWSADFLRHVRALTAARGIPLIADEVFTGFGRTGKLFACEHGPVSPDILCLSKGLTAGYMPFAATLASESIYDAFLSDDRRRTLFHGHSYTGNALACAVALESLAIFDDERTLTRIRALELQFEEQRRRLRAIPAIKADRGIGALAAFEIAPDSGGGYLDDLGPRLYREFLNREILLRPLGNILYFLPPYSISDEEVERVFAAIEEVVSELG